jgi:guanylate kinase
MNTEKNSKTGYLFIVSGPSGVGKTVLCNHIVQRHYPKVVYSISTTSRAPRGGETDGQEYNFCTPEEFERDIANDAFAEWAKVHGNYYGTPKKFLVDEMAAGRSVVLNIDVQGALEINGHYPEAIMIFILPPNFEELENRIRKRNMDSESSLKNRLENARQELEFTGKYQHVLVNDDLELAQTELEKIFLTYIA